MTAEEAKKVAEEVIKPLAKKELEAILFCIKYRASKGELHINYEPNVETNVLKYVFKELTALGYSYRYNCYIYSSDREIYRIFWE